jgi:hypothetical protein
MSPRENSERKRPTLVLYSAFLVCGVMHMVLTLEAKATTDSRWQQCSESGLNTLHSGDVLLVEREWDGDSGGGVEMAVEEVISKDVLPLLGSKT